MNLFKVLEKIEFDILQQRKIIKDIKKNFKPLKNIKMDDLPIDEQSQKIINNSNNKLKELKNKKIEIIKDLKCKYFYRQAVDSDSTCPISLEEFKKGNLIFKTECNHLFKFENLMEWIIITKESIICPYCRQKILNEKYSKLFIKLFKNYY